MVVDQCVSRDGIRTRYSGAAALRRDAATTGRAGYVFMSFVLAELFFACLVTQGQAQSGVDTHNFAVGLYKQGRWSLAGEEFRRFITRNPDHSRVPSARLYLGLALVNLEQFAEARQQFRTFADDYPQHRNLPDARYRIGECSYQHGDFVAAEKELRTWLESYSTHALADWALSYLGDSRMALGQYDAAIDTFNRLISDHPRSETLQDAELSLARAYERAGRRQDAFRTYQRITSNRDGSHARKALSSIGGMYFQAGNYEEAAAAYQQIEQKFPDDPLAVSARLNGGVANYRSERFREAIKLFRKVPGDHRYASHARLLEGMSHMQLKDFRTAIEVFTAARQAFPDSEKQESLLYHQADSERQLGNYERAGTLFLQTRERWPDGQYHVEILHFAAESLLLDDQLDEALELLNEFERLHGDSELRPRHDLLRGRLLSARGGESNERKAMERFELVVDNEVVDARTRSLGRYYMTGSLSRLGEHQKALDVGQPLVDLIRSGADTDGLEECLVLVGQSALALGRHEQARLLLTDYLTTRPRGGRVAEALSLRATASARMGDADAARKDLNQLHSEFPRSGRYEFSLTLLAEIAWNRGDHRFAATLFDDMARQGPESALQPRGLSGYGWCLFEMGQFANAADAFGTLVSKYPGNDLAAEAAWMQGKALSKDNRNPEAIRVWQAAFRQYAPKPPAAAGAEQDGAAQHAFQAGIMAAQLAAELGTADDADATWKTLLEHFPRAENADKLCEQWAWMNLDAERFERSDEVFRRLIQDYPDSPLVAGAQLALAESELVNGNADAASQSFEALLADAVTPDDVREASLFQLIRVYRDREDWPRVAELSGEFQTRFADSEYDAECRMRMGEAQFMSGQTEQATETLETTRRQLLSLPPDGWHGRVWVVLAEIHVRVRRYEEVRRLAAELEDHDADSPFLYQIWAVVGVSYQQQALPDFARARRYFKRVIADPHGRATQTAAKSQFMIGETWIKQSPPDHAQALRAYLATNISYPYPEWQAPALFQAARCDEAMGDVDKAIENYETLVRDHPQVKYARDARDRLAELRVLTPK